MPAFTEIVYCSNIHKIDYHGAGKTERYIHEGAEGHG